MRLVRDRRLIALGVVGLMLLGGSLGTFWFLFSFGTADSALGPLTVRDANNIVTIDLPAGWEDTTARNAGQISTETDSGDTVPAYRVPQISAYRDFADKDSQSGSWLTVTIEAATAATDREQHLMEVQKVRDDYGATFTSPETIPDISGYPALRSSGTVAGSASDLFVITVRSPDYFITINGNTALHRRPGWDNLPTDPRREELARQVSKARVS